MPGVKIEVRRGKLNLGALSSMMELSGGLSASWRKMRNSNG